MPAVYVNGPRTVMGFETLSVGVSAVGPTATVIRTTTATNAQVGAADLIAEWAVEAFCTVETAPVRYRIDGTAPTTAIGHLLNANDTLTVQGYTNIKNLQFIQQGASAGTVRITYFK